ncbi:MAG: hypothetical protein GY853_15825 [PVC group bacterium]|nr:hypothetical protein [PVC group bacterium]
MFNRRNWSGRDLLNKIQMISFLVLYMMLPLMINLLRDPTGGVTPGANITVFVYVCIGIVFYVVVMGWVSERILRLRSEEYAGRRVMVGTLDEGGGKGEDYEFIIADIFPYDLISEYEQEGLLRVEGRINEYELEDKSVNSMQIEDKSDVEN